MTGVQTCALPISPAVRFGGIICISFHVANDRSMPATVARNGTGGGLGGDACRRICGYRSGTWNGQNAHRGVEIGSTRISDRRHHMPTPRSEEHTSELQSLMRISYAVFCLKKNK